MEALSDAREDGTFLGAGLIANGHDVGDELPGLEDVENGLRFLFGNIDPDFLHRFDHERIQRSRLEAGALGVEKVAAKMIEPRLGHLAAGAVVNADEKNVWLHDA